jgi:hypothetical protein
MRTMKGPGVFLVQFAGDAAPFSTIDGLARWSAAKGFKGVQNPTWDTRVIDLKTAVESQAYCDDFMGCLSKHGLALTELATTCKANSSRSIRRSTFLPIPSRLRRCAAIRKRAGSGRNSNCAMRRKPRMAGPGVAG